MAVDESTFFRDHWMTIEPEKLAYLDSIWDLPEPVMELLLAPLGLIEGDVAIDLGCGPGFLAVAMARQVGRTGRVHGLDVNEEFLTRAVSNAEARGVGAVCSFDLIEDHHLPFESGSVDGLFAKNVFEYVTDVDVSLGEAHRVLTSGGRVTGICCDYGFYVAEPLSPSEVRELFDAAAPAFRDPFIGRRLRQAMRIAGFVDVQTTVVTMPDVTGTLRGVLENMLGHALRFGHIEQLRIDEMRDRLDAALADGSYMVVQPAFVCTGTRP
jgi:ubiquinone/menaquinone biosynthesis C-methylase UbiE